MPLDPARTVAELKELRELTGDENGAQRVAWTDTWVQAREWLRGKLEGLPPAYVVTCEFDPLRDEGIAYGDALAKAGVPVEQLKAHGQFHSSFTMVDVIITGVSGRMKMAEALRRFAGLPPEVSRGDEHGHGLASPGRRIAAAAS